MKVMEYIFNDKVVVVDRDNLKRVMVEIPESDASKELRQIKLGGCGCSLGDQFHSNTSGLTFQKYFKVYNNAISYCPSFDINEVDDILGYIKSHSKGLVRWNSSDSYYCDKISFDTGIRIPYSDVKIIINDPELVEYEDVIKECVKDLDFELRISFLYKKDPNFRIWNERDQIFYEKNFNPDRIRRIGAGVIARLIN